MGAVLLGADVLAEPGRGWEAVEAAQSNRFWAAEDPRSARVNLNTASAAQLEQLPGIGPQLAERIVSDRRAAGAYSELTDLQRVPGIGPSTVDRLRCCAEVR